MSTLALAITLSVFLAQQRESAVALLREVEAATASLRDFQADVTVDRVDALTEESERRMGRIALSMSGGITTAAHGAGADDAAAPVPAGGTSHIVLVLDRFIGPDGRADESRRLFIYEGGWFAEIDEERRQFVNRQLVPPGQTFNPLRVGEGPLPIPIGQRADDALAFFEPMPVMVPTTGLLKSLEGVRGVRLTPRPGSVDAQETLAVDLYYDQRSLLPRGVVQRRAGGGRVEVLLRKPVMNEGLSEADRALMHIRTPDPREGWSVDVRPWKRSSEPMNGE